MKKTFAIAFVAAVAVVTAGGLAINRSNPVVMKDGTRSSITSKPADGPVPTCYPDQSCH
jgi:hypothetical protein